MLAKKFRLTKKRDFEILAEEGRSFFINEMGVKYRKNNLDYSRFAFIVSTKVDKRSTARNKIKRRLREIVHQNLKIIKPGFDVLVIAKPEIKNLDFWSMKEKLEGIFKKLAFLKE
ncbi:MAG: ribonuclease P protein component [Patescibacteria group bacterium]